jgi:hypothetical protein
MRAYCECVAAAPDMSAADHDTAKQIELGCF